MTFSLRSLLTSAAFGLAVILPLAANADDKALTKEQVEAIVKDVIKNNPDLILKSLSEYQVQQEAKRISEAAQNVGRMKDEIQNDPDSPSIGNPDGDVTITEFFDYHCGYCKRFFPEIAQLIQEDKGVRVVFKEFPILSEDSVTASRGALAVWTLDKSKYFDYHILLMKESGGFNEEVLTDKATQLGISAEDFKKAFNDPKIDKMLAKNKALGKQLDIGATPTILVGELVAPGAISMAALKAKIEDVRDEQKQKKATKHGDD